MKRREVLGLLGSTTVISLPGCLDDDSSTGDETDDSELDQTSPDGEVVAEVDPDDLSNHELFEQYQAEEATHVEDDEYAVAVKLLQYVYIPGTVDPIEVPENSEVSFYLGSKDVTHAFTIEEKGVNVEVPPGEIIEVTVQFEEYEESTEYEITCSERFCEKPEQQDAMTGWIRVLPEP